MLAAARNQTGLRGVDFGAEPWAFMRNAFGVVGAGLSPAPTHSLQVARASVKAEHRTRRLNNLHIHRIAIWPKG